MSQRKLLRLSKFMSLILRHRPEILKLKLDDQGFVDVSLKEFTSRISQQQRFDWVTEKDIVTVVKTDAKKRYEIINDRIRACYGHSVPVNLLTTNGSNNSVPDILFHGTSPANIDSILTIGLTSQNRTHVHLSESKELAYQVGRRHSKRPIILKINVQGLIREGHVIKRVGEGIFITDYVPSHYVSVLKE